MPTRLEPTTAQAPLSVPPAVRVIAVTYSPGPVLDRMLASLAAATSGQVSVFIADNGSADGAPERAAAGGRAILLRTGSNVGYGAAANLGAEGATEPFLLLTNPDVEFAPGSVDELVAATERWPQGGAFGPAVREPDGRLYPSARALPVVGHGIGHALLARLWPGNPWTKAYRNEDLAVIERVAGWLSGSCLLVRREAFEAVGGFDPGYFMYFEDVDLGARLARAGWQSVYVPTAEVLHLGGTTTQRYPRRMLKAHHDSAYRYLATRYPLPVRWVLRLGLGLRYALLARRLPRDR